LAIQTKKDVYRAGHEQDSYSARSISLAEKVKTAPEPPAAFPDDFGRARALQTLGEIDSLNGDHEQAIEKLQSALALYQRLNGKTEYYDFYVASVYGALGRVHPEVGESSRALFYLNKALDIAKAQSNNHLAASLRNDLGFLYMEQEDYEQAKTQFSESLKTYAVEKNQREEARVLGNIGVVAQRSTNYDEALRYFRLSLQAAEATKFIDVQVADYEGIGVVLTEKKDFAGAIDALNRALTIAKDSRDKARQSEILWRTAQTSYEMGNFAQSESLATNALSLARMVRLPKLTYLATTTLGQSYAALKRADLAIQTLTQAVGEIESMRGQVAGRDEERRGYFENTIAPYQTLVDLLAQQGRPLEALSYAERAKGRVLLDVLSGGQADLSNVLTATERQEAQDLNRRMFEINERIRKEETASPASVNSLYTQLDGVRLKYQSFQDAVFAAHPDLRVRSGHAAPMTVADITHPTDDKGGSYLEYVVTKDNVYLFALTNDITSGAQVLRVYTIAIRPDELARRVNEFHDMLANRNPLYPSAARELYALLLGPAEEQVRDMNTICIIPDGILWNVPFQALITHSDRFLIEEHALYYAPSLNVLSEMNRKKATERKAAASLIAFGNPAISTEEQRYADSCPLPEAEAEVTSIANNFGQGNGRFFIGREASEKTFKSLVHSYSVVHLATHGVIDNRQPLFSYLLLTRSEGDPDNDGRLEAREIMEMNLHADLVVLSACDTANGKISPGEGVMGMSWAFFVAGTRSMLVSQWGVNSVSTSELMINFYKDLKANHTDVANRKAQALRDAVLRMIKDPCYRHPFNWAGFVLLGSAS